jgi:2-methylcitrate dehydratase PrpD
VTVTTGEGTIERSAIHMRGEPEIPMSFDDVAAKLAELAPNHQEDARAAVVEAAMDLENRSVADLVAPLRTGERREA